MRYFLEVSYKGTNYAGFQVQANAPTIQSELERACKILLKKEVKLTGSSRTDAGVHAHQNYFHVDVDVEIAPAMIYNFNALLPPDIAVKSIQLVNATAHSRFDALTREYSYFIYSDKSPFLSTTAWYYPYKINFDQLQNAATLLLDYSDFTSFAKRNSQVHNHVCTMVSSAWQIQSDTLVYTVKANRFLRGMVRGLVGTMLQVGRGIVDVEGFQKIIQDQDNTKANFTTPPHGLFLNKVEFPHDYFTVFSTEQ